MSKRWGVALLVPPGWDPDSDDADEAIAYRFEHVPSYLEVAQELWALVSPERAGRVRELVLTAFGRQPHLLGGAEVAALGQALDGLEPSLRDAGWIDARGEVPAERLPELARRTTLLDLGAGFVASAAIGSALSWVAIARHAVETAVDKQLDLLLD
jgi:hypothetical protein